MLSFTFINSHFQVSDPGPESPLVENNTLTPLDMYNGLSQSVNDSLKTLKESI